MSRTDVICDRSKEKLTKTPTELLEMKNLKMLFLEGNFLSLLPEEFFWKLPKLMWLDLRNNLLEEIPKSIANHEHLENLLLTNNNLQRLPNELGLLPKLKALQVSENPLVYPLRKIIVDGTKAIKNFLKEQYQKHHPDSPSESDTNVKSEDDLILSEEDAKFENEKLVNVIDDFGTGNESEKSISKTSKKSSKSKPSKQSLSEKMRKKLCDPYLLEPTLNVKKIENPVSSKTFSKKYVEKQPMKIVHKISKTGSKISLMSYFNRLDTRSSKSKIEDNNLRMGWLNQLRILLNDQEKILQQERNLRAISEWRWKQRTSTPKVFKDRSQLLNSEPPYAVYPEYSKIPSREELTEQLTSFFRENSIEVSNKTTKTALNIDKLINDLMQQLKEMEGIYSATNETRSPRSEVDQAGKQIKTIMEIQKKLLKLKSTQLI